MGTVDPKVPFPSDHRSVIRFIPGRLLSSRAYFRFARHPKIRIAIRFSNNG